MEELKTYSIEELTQRDVQNVQRELHCNEEQVKAAKPNLTAIAVIIKCLSFFTLTVINSNISRNTVKSN